MSLSSLTFLTQIPELKTIMSSAAPNSFWDALALFGTRTSQHFTGHQCPLRFPVGILNILETYIVSCVPSET